jgi:2-polyprenyl-6-methoxyphenol hydroxylase-like FAD-dependent oxidoreductase
MTTRRIAIVGAGLAGLTAAIAARRLGLEARLYEQTPDFKQVGGGIMIHSNGLRVLETLGLLDSFAPQMRLTQRLQVEAPGGKPLSVVDLGQLSIPHNQAAVVLRYKLQEHLLVAGEREGVEVAFDHRLTDLSCAKGRAVLRFADGAEEEFDLVIGGDGLNSQTRESAGLGGARPPLAEAYVRGVSDWPSRESTVREIWGRDGRRFGICPLPGKQTYFFGSVPLGKWQEIVADRSQLDAWIESWSNLNPDVIPLLRAVSDWQRVNYSELREVCLDRWFRPPVFIIGDAAHAMTPNLGQGANSAMVDSLVLMRLLARTLREGTPLEEAGRAYDALRRPFVGRIQKTARQIGQLAAMTSPVGRCLQKTAFFLTRAIGPLRRQSLRLATGYNPAEDAYFQPLSPG